MAFPERTKHWEQDGEKLDNRLIKTLCGRWVINNEIALHWDKVTCKRCEEAQKEHDRNEV